MKRLTILFLSLVPSVSYGALQGDPRVFSDIVGTILDLITLAVPVLAGAALLAFFWGLTKFIFKSGDEANHQEGKDLMKWGIVALFIMVSYMAIINFFYGGVGFGSSAGLPLLPIK